MQKGLFMSVSNNTSKRILKWEEEKRPEISVAVSNICEEHRQTNTKRYELTRSKDYAFKLLCSKQFSSYRIRWLEDNFQTLERLRRGKSQVDSRPNLICECQHVYLIMSFSKWQYYWECIRKSIQLSQSRINYVLLSFVSKLVFFKSRFHSWFTQWQKKT